MLSFHMLPMTDRKTFLKYLSIDITAYCICEIHCIALDEFDLKTVHQLNSKEKKSQLRRDSNPGLLGGKEECCLCTTQPLLML